jgi:hypothetical protein
MKFTIDCKSAAQAELPSVVACIAALKKLPDGELKTRVGLASAAGISPGTILHIGTSLPDEYKANQGRLMIYGNAKTIKAWRAWKIHN